jgi:methylmalonyl-CoA mutase N-terminal domain/subunit
VSTDRKEKIIVGVNDFVGEEKPIEILRIDESVRVQQAKQLRQLRSERSSNEVARQLKALRNAAQATENLMPHIYTAVKAYATLGEICDSLRDVFGTHQEAPLT